MNEQTTEEILSLIINLEYMLKCSNTDKLDMKLKVLHIINQNEKTTPSKLIEKLGMARSNLAIICNKLTKEELISKRKELLNKKEIFYELTTKGKDYLKESYTKIEGNLTKLRNKNKIVKLSKELAKLI